MKLDLTWGESVAVRKAFVKNITRPYDYIQFTRYDLLDMGYTPHEGDAETIEITREIIKRQTGVEYKYIALTNGCTGAISVALTAFDRDEYTSVMTSEAPFFRMYPGLIKNCGYSHAEIPLSDTLPLSRYSKSIVLLDSPSNPQNIIHNFSNMAAAELAGHTVVWDTVYHTRAYVGQVMPDPVKHTVNVGSYSKLTGLNGIRVGWIATNDPLYWERVKETVGNEYCGLSSGQYKILKTILTDFDWELFEIKAQSNLDDNRIQWSKLEKYFGGKAVDPIGMFYYGPADAACKRLMDKAGVLYTLGSKCHHNDDYVRINIGQDMDVVKTAVQKILAADKI